MLVPNIIIVDESGPEEGADIKPECIVVRKENLDTLVEGFRLFMPGIGFMIYTKEGYEAHQKEEAGTSKKKENTDSIDPE